jgi:hypothetical protein
MSHLYPSFTDSVSQPRRPSARPVSRRLPPRPPQNIGLRVLTDLGAIATCTGLALATAPALADGTLPRVSDLMGIQRSAQSLRAVPAQSSSLWQPGVAVGDEYPNYANTPALQARLQDNTMRIGQSGAIAYPVVRPYEQPAADHVVLDIDTGDAVID